ncbi:MAG: hypothetical protein J5798_13540 [Spirochaetaceae bacterium]|nr:hypothetical protein [Spirochaetaceae bacterium]
MMKSQMRTALVVFIELFLLIVNAAGIGMTTSYFGTKAPEEPKEVGDIVFSDGSATPLALVNTLTSKQRNAVVAYIFYSGIDCSDNEINRTLGVGLKRSSTNVQWCSPLAEASNKNIDTIQENVKNGSQNLAKIGNWLTVHPTKDQHFTDDTSVAANYPAFYYAKNYGIANALPGMYAKGWYLPSKTELEKVYDQREMIDAVCALCSLSDKFSNVWFWSSTQYAFNSHYACKMYFFCGKSYGSAVCAIREF